MRWVSRLFDARDTFVRMLLLDLSGVGYLVFGAHAGRPPTGVQWMFAGLAFATALFFHRHQQLNLIGQSILLFFALHLIEDPTINQVGAGWALLELAMWTPRLRSLGWSTALVAAVYATDWLGDPPRRLVSEVFGLSVTLGVPVLFGLVVRTTRELSHQAARRTAEERRRRDADDRAARADERAAIARELHDVVAHHVASMVLRVGVARHVLPDVDARVSEVFDDVHRTGTTALSDLRGLVALLRDPEGAGRDAALTAIEPSALPNALGAAVDTARRAGLTVDADVDERAGALDSVRGLAVLRLTQEALTNVAKHAGASAHARLRVGVTAPGDVVWEVSDDGGGSRPADPPPGGGHGLTGMRERVDVLGGELEAGPHGGGWRVRTVLPAPGPPGRPAGTPPLSADRPTGPPAAAVGVEGAA